MAGFLGLGGKRAAGLFVSAGLLLASCTQVVTGKGAADHAALASYLSSSSSSMASESSASSSKAAAVKQAVCSQLPVVMIQVTLAWNNFVTAINNGDKAAANQVKELQNALGSASSQIKSANADSDTDIGKAVADYIGSLDALASILNRGKATVDEMNDSHQKINSAGDSLMGLCPP